MQLVERNSWIAELEAQIAEASKNAETAHGLRVEIAELKQQGADERVELYSAGQCCNVKAAKAALGDY